MLIPYPSIPSGVAILCTPSSNKERFDAFFLRAGQYLPSLFASTELSDFVSAQFIPLTLRLRQV